MTPAKTYTLEPLTKIDGLKWMIDNQKACLYDQNKQPHWFNGTKFDTEAPYDLHAVDSFVLAPFYKPIEESDFISKYVANCQKYYDGSATKERFFESIKRDAQLIESLVDGKVRPLEEKIEMLGRDMVWAHQKIRDLQKTES